LGLVDSGLTEDRYVSGIEYKEVTNLPRGVKSDTVGGLFVVHHSALAVFDPDGDDDPRQASSWPVHEVGRNSDVFDAEAGRLMKADSKVSFFSSHLHANGIDTEGRL